MDHIEKLLRRVPPKHRAQILAALECLQNRECRAMLRIEKLSGSSSAFKIHAGRYRIIFTASGTDIEILDVRLRNEKTYRDF